MEEGSQEYAGRRMQLMGELASKALVGTSISAYLARLSHRRQHRPTHTTDHGRRPRPLLCGHSCFSCCATLQSA